MTDKEREEYRKHSKAIYEWVSKRMRDALFPATMQMDPQLGFLQTQRDMLPLPEGDRQIIEKE